MTHAAFMGRPGPADMLTTPQHLAALLVIGPTVLWPDHSGCAHAVPKPLE